MEDQIIKIMAEVFSVDSNQITENASPENIEAWDSLKQMNLVISLEEHFNITFLPEEISEMISLKKIKEIIDAKVK